MVRDKIVWLASWESPESLERQLTHAREAYRLKPANENVELCEILHAALVKKRAARAAQERPNPVPGYGDGE